MFKKFFTKIKELWHWYDTHRESRIKIISDVTLKINKYYKRLSKHMQYIAIFNDFIQKVASVYAQSC